ncbi:hypothetical protein H0486_04665 [Lachnospiraceae bacterium MD1]|uniref:Transglutaminase domain-containing protein n=1 Tax=Variimorphobacter saccharofermentans TaxID=2755051 RepID=A0A839JXN3_9FIRM|nr:hypothetical protein [Variimorphobacter saccharofermentans]MBB2182166.1 hypothetical protein [Variimorphobacter saccharofermentans]
MKFIKRHMKSIIFGVIILLLGASLAFVTLSLHNRIRYSYYNNGIIYRGILINNSTFTSGEAHNLVYDFDCSEYDTILEKYNIKSIAGDGSEFDQAVKLMQHFSPLMRHASNYDGHVPQNSLDLLDYSLEGNGINCKAKSKILSEIYLALGIYSRRVWLMPYSPEDNECHVVTEIYDNTYKKWILLDNTNNLYFVNKENIPLSALEIREYLTKNADFSVVYCYKSKIFESIYDSFICSKEYMISYYQKNTAYFIVESHNTFDLPEDDMFYYLLPDNFEVEETKAYPHAKISKESMYQAP